MILWVVIGAAYLSATPISLEEVKTESRRNVQAVNAELDRARATASTAGVRSAALPQLQLYSSDGLTVAGRQRVIQPTTLPDGGVLIGPTDIPPYSNPQLSLGVALNQILFDWGRWKQIAQAGSQEEASRGQAVEQLQFAEYEGVRRFFALYSAQRSLAVLEANATRSQQLVDRAQALFTAGRGSRSDVLASQVNLNNDRITAVRQHTAITQTSADLSAWLARPETEELDAVEPPGLDGTPIPPPSLEEALNTARSSRPLLKVVAAQLKASDLGVEVAKSGYLPRLTLSVNYSRSGVSANPVFTDPTRQNSATGTVNLAWDFFNGLATLAAARGAEAVRTQAQNTLDQTVRDVEGSIRIGRTTLEISITVLRMSKENQQTAALGLTAAQARFSAGAGSTLEVRDAQLKLAQADLSLLQSRVDVEVARASLARLTGSI